MQSELVRDICQVGVFIICAQVIVHFRPSKSYEKYLKMLVSAMILIQLLRPVGAVLDRDNAEGLESRIKRFAQQLNENRRKVENDSARGEALREQMTLEEVRRRIAAEKDAAEKEESAGEAGVQEEPEGAYAPRSGGKLQIEEIRPVETISVSGERGE